MKNFTQLIHKKVAHSGFIIIVLTVLGLMYTSLGVAQTTQTFNSSGTFVVPAGVTSVTVEMWGGGGGGGSRSGNRGAGGGGGGAYTKKNIVAVSSGASINVTVGLGGTGGINGANGTNGGQSIFSSGTVVNANGGTFGNQSAAGTGGVAGTTGDTNRSGGAGGTNSGAANSGGAGGGAAGNNTANGLAGSANSGGTGGNGGVGVSPAGSGGKGGNNDVDGANGTQPGGGGGGEGGNSDLGGHGGDGSVVVTWTCPAAYELTAAATATGPFCGTSSSTVTLHSSSMPTGTYTVTYNLGGATTATGSTATMTFTAGSPGTGTFITPTLALGTTNITITNLSSGSGCINTISTNNTTSVLVNASPTVNAGAALSALCQGGTSAALNGTVGGSATGGIWSDGGVGGTFNPDATTLNATWTPPAAYSGSAVLTLTTTGGSCGSVNQGKTQVVNPQPTATAGGSQTICFNQTATVSGATSSNGTILWTRNGFGSLTGATTLTPVYTPAAGDAGTTVTLTMTVTNSPCTAATATYIVLINAIPSITSVTAPSTSICANATQTLTANGVAGAGATVTWYTATNGGGTNLGTGTTLTNQGPGTYFARVTGTCAPAVEASITISSLALPAITSVTAPSTSICANATQTLTANGAAGAGATVTWWTATNGGGTNLGTGATLTNQGPGTYYARVTGTCTPAVEALITVTSIALPSITNVTAPSSSICANATQMLTANGVAGAGATVTWFTATNGGGTNLGTGVTLANRGPGTYFARVTGTCTPAVEASITVTSIAIPAITSVTAPSTSICANATQTLTANGVAGAGTSVTWWTATNGGGTNLGTGATLTNQGPGTYYARVTGTCTPAVEALITVTSIALPAITSVTAPSTSICANATQTLSANGVAGAGATVTWFTATNGGGTNLGTGVTLTNRGPGTYFARVTGTCTPAVEASITILSIALPAITSVTAPSTSICANATQTLSANGVAGAGATVTWYTATNGGGTNLGTGTTLTDQGPGTYFARVTGTCTPAVESSITVSSIALPAITNITGNGSNPSCSNVTQRLTANGVAGAGATVTWYTDTNGGGTNLGTGTSLNNRGPGTYYARVTGTCTPAVEASITILSLDLPAISDVTAPSASICANATQTLTANGVAGAGATVTWYTATNGGGTNLGTGTTLTDQGPGTYFARVTGTCTPAVEASITVSSKTFSTIPTSITGTTSICEGASTTLTVLGGSLGTGAIAQWFAGSCGSPFTLTGNSITIMPTETTTYFVRYSGDCNTTDCISVEVIVNPIQTPTVVLTSSDADNTFEYGTPITFTATPSSVAGNTGIVYTFKLNGTTVQTGASNTYAVSNLRNGQQVSVSIAVSGGTCMVSNSANSNTITNTVTGAVFVDFIYTIATCGVVSNTINPTFYCSTPIVTGTLGYRFKIKNMTTLAEVIVDRTVPNANLLLTSLAAYNTLYTVNVAAIVDGIEHPYSADCTVTTPALQTNKVVDGQCGGTLAAINSTINVLTVSGAQNYRFRVALSTAPTTYEIVTSPFPSFRLSSLTTLILNYGKTYLIEVQSDILNNGVSGTSAYGAVCSVNTPSVASISATPNSCGATLAIINDRIFVNGVPGANQYTYRVALASNPGVYNDIVTPFSNFRLTSLTTVPLLFESTYNVQVSVRVNVGGTNFDSGFGSACQYTTPIFLEAEVQASQCGSEAGAYQVPTNNTDIIANFVSGASYRFKLEKYTGLTLDYSQTIVRPVNNFRLNMFTGLDSNTEYTVSVALNYYGEADFGKDCAIRTPPAARLAQVSFSAIAYPNPFAENFKIDVKSNSASVVSIKVYDMLGRVVEERSAKVNELETATIGNNYPTGVYNVIVTQDSDVSTIRMIKR